MLVSYDTVHIKLDDVAYADAAFLQMFDFPLKEGNRKTGAGNRGRSQIERHPSVGRPDSPGRPAQGTRPVHGKSSLLERSRGRIESLGGADGGGGHSREIDGETGRSGEGET